MPISRSLLLACLLLASAAAPASRAAQTPETTPDSAADAAAPARSAEAILEEFHSLEAPVPQLERMEDPDYAAEYEHAFEAVVQRQALLVYELLQVDPEHEALDSLLDLLWARTGINEMRIEGYDPIAHMQRYIEAHPDRPAVRRARFYLPLSRLYRMESLEDEASLIARERAFAEIDEYLQLYPEEELKSRLKLVFQKYHFVGPDETEQLARIHEQVIEIAPNTKQARRAKGQLRQINEIGEPFELEHKDLLSGETISAQEFHGKVVAVIFWATHSAPCQTLLPRWEEILDTHRDQGLVYIGVPLDWKEERVREFCAEKEVEWPQLWLGPQAKDFAEGWAISAVPVIFLLDREGRLVDTRGAVDFEKKLRTLLKDDEAAEDE